MVVQYTEICQCNPPYNKLKGKIKEKYKSQSNFALTMNNEDIHLVKADPILNAKIEETAKKENIAYTKGTTLCSDCFDYYMTDISKLFERMPKDLTIIGAEMEAFALFYTAHVLGKKAACLLTVVDSHYYKEQASSQDREQSLTNMIRLALQAAIS